METELIQLDPEDVILLILEANERLLRKTALNGITRLEKLLFILERETDFEGIGSFFIFEPHNFGPFSKEVYAAIDFLNGCELIDVSDKMYGSPYVNSEAIKLLSEISDDDDDTQFEIASEVTEKQFALTDNGRRVAHIIRDAIQRRRPEDVRQLDLVVRRYGTWPLNHLIRYVYRQHPDMTINSIHPAANTIVK